VKVASLPVWRHLQQTLLIVALKKLNATTLRHMRHHQVVTSWSRFNGRRSAATGEWQTINGWLDGLIGWVK